jgi:hypothetical protein
MEWGNARRTPGTVLALRRSAVGGADPPRGPRNAPRLRVPGPRLVSPLAACAHIPRLRCANGAPRTRAPIASFIPVRSFAARRPRRASSDRGPRKFGVGCPRIRSLPRGRSIASHVARRGERVCRLTRPRVEAGPGLVGVRWLASGSGSRAPRGSWARAFSVRLPWRARPGSVDTSGAVVYDGGPRRHPSRPCFSRGIPRWSPPDDRARLAPCCPGRGALHGRWSASRSGCARVAFRLG